jgi:hypothetical protein
LIHHSLWGVVDFLYATKITPKIVSELQVLDSFRDLNLKPSMIKYLNIKQSLALLNHKEELYGLHDLIRLISQGNLRPCFYFDKSMQPLPDSGYSQNTIETIEDGFNFSGYITPRNIKPLAQALLRPSSNAEIIHFSSVKVIESTDAQYFVRLPEVRWYQNANTYVPVIFVPADHKKINILDDYVLIQEIGQFGKNVKTGCDFDARSCLFIASELEQVFLGQAETSLNNQAGSVDVQCSIKVSGVVGDESKIWDVLVERADSVREAMVEIFKLDTEISGSAMWAALNKMAENEDDPFLEVRSKNDQLVLMYRTKSQSDQSIKSINQRSVERRLIALKKEFKAVKAQ